MITTPRRIPSSAPYYDDPDIEVILAEVRKILQSKRLVLGQYTKRLEELFSQYVGTKHAVAVNSATAALETVLTYIDVKDSEVIVPTNTFIACPNTVMYSGGKPIFADMDPDSFCLNVDDVKRKITSKTKAIMAVHLAGLPDPALGELAELCNEKGIKLFEDCSHAHGASINGRKVGSLSLAGCFSLFATKIMPVGTGGLITTDDSDLSIFAEEMRHQGGLGGEGQIESFEKFGYDFMISEITAELAISQLSKLDRQLSIRRKIAEMYRKELTDVKYVRLPRLYNDSQSAHWKFIVMLHEDVDRNKVREIMRKEYLIDAGILYPTLCHLQPVYQKLGYDQKDCPVGREVMKHQLTLPVNPYMGEDDVRYVIDSLQDVIRRCLQ